MPIRGIRGATTAAANTRDAILDATGELLEAMVKLNGVCVDDVASAIFTLTSDLDAAFPASAARSLGWNHVPLLDVSAPRVGNDLSRCIRVLVHWNTERKQAEIAHVYLRDARALRPDLVKDQMP